MKLSRITIASFSCLSIFLIQCSKHHDESTRLQIYIYDSVQNKVPNVTVKLYNYSNTFVAQQVTGSDGAVLFSNLDPIVYYWTAEKGCANNHNTEYTLGSELVPNALLYGISNLYDAGILKIKNNSAETYSVTVVGPVNIAANSEYIFYPRIGAHIIHTESAAIPGSAKDTLINISCTETNMINLP